MNNTYFEDVMLSLREHCIINGFNYTVFIKFGNTIYIQIHCDKTGYDWFIKKKNLDLNNLYVNFFLNNYKNKEYFEFLVKAFIEKDFSKINTILTFS